MTAADLADGWDDLFHGCAMAAFVEQARADGGWPGREGTRRRACRLCEDELAAENRPVPVGPSPALTGARRSGRPGTRGGGGVVPADARHGPQAVGRDGKTSGRPAGG